MTEEKISEYLETAVDLANVAGEILRKFWGNIQHIQNKGISGDLVTEADKESDKAILERLQKKYPTHSILTEESGEHKIENSDFLWVIDPLDGTTNYAHQNPLFSVSIALLYKGKAIVGVVYNPIYNELFYGAHGQGAYLKGNPINVSNTGDLAQSLLATGFRYDRRQNPDNNYKEFVHLTDLTQGVRRLGSAALDIAYVASGRIDGYWERGIKPWDIAAGVLLVEEAGGSISSYDGASLDIFSGEIIVSNSLIHEVLTEEIVKIRGFK